MAGLRKWIDLVLGRFLVFLMGFMVLNVLWQVFTRFILRDPSSYTEEIARFLLIWIGLLGASYVAGQKMHLAIDILPQSLSGARKVALDFFIDLCIFLFALVVLVIGGGRLVFITFSLEQVSAALQIQLGYVYLVLPLSGLLFLFYSIHSLLDHLARWKLESSR